MKGRQVSQLQCAALPYRRCADSTIEIMLITSRDTGRWLIPKGWRKPRLGAAASAAREAHEEGGLVGRIGKHSIGLFTMTSGFGTGPPYNVQLRFCVGSREAA